MNVSSGSHSADLSKETSFLILDSVEPNNSYYPGTETPVTVYVAISTLLIISLSVHFYIGYKLWTKTTDIR